MIITAAAGTHVGRVRSNNEDNFYINGFYREDVEENYCIYAEEGKREFYTYAVCDGVGGVEYGEVASLRAIEQLVEFDGPELEQNINEYVKAANDTVCQEIQEKGGKRMGSTLVLMTIKGETASLCNVGDSRAYLMRENALRQLSHDHTRLQRMIDAGIVKQDGDVTLRKDHVLTQFLGVFPEEFLISPHLEEVIQLEDGDLFLLCSDGLSDMVKDEELEEMLRSNPDKTPQEIVDELISAALVNGGKDNITAIVVRVKQEG